MAADGALVGGRCYASQEDAADAFYSSSAPSHAPGGTYSYLSEFVKVSGVWKLRRYQVDASGGVFVQGDAVMPAMSFASCDPAESFKDGMQVGWAVVAAMVVAWCVVVLRRGL